MPDSVYKIGRIIIMVLFFVPVYALERVTVSDAWVNQPPPGITTMAGYMTIHNSRKTPVELIHASSPEFKKIEFHLSQLNDGIASMQKLEKIEIDPGESFSFSPGKYHFMLFLPDGQTITGNFIPITLEFYGNESMEVKAVLRRGQHHQHQHQE